MPDGPGPMVHPALPPPVAGIDDDREEVIRMIFLAVVTLTMVVFLGAATWSALTETKTDGRTGPAKDSGRAREAAKPATLEGELVRQLMDHAISRVQYHRAMQRLAERDAERHPMSVPPQN